MVESRTARRTLLRALSKETKRGMLKHAFSGGGGGRSPRHEMYMPRIPRRETRYRFGMAESKVRRKLAKARIPFRGSTRLVMYGMCRINTASVFWVPAM